MALGRTPERVTKTNYDAAGEDSALFRWLAELGFSAENNLAMRILKKDNVDIEKTLPPWMTSGGTK